jgi:hypothetical protein
MVATRSGGAKATADSPKNDRKKRSSSASASTKKTPAKKAKKEEDGKLEIGDNGELGLASKDEGEDAEMDEGDTKNTKAGGSSSNGVGVAKMTNERGEDETKGYTDAEAGSDDKSIKALVEGEGEQKGETGVEEEQERRGKSGTEVKEDETEEPSHGKSIWPILGHLLIYRHPREWTHLLPLPSKD